MIMQSIMNMFLMIFSLLTYQLKHPLAMGGLLLIQTILICMITGLMNETFWFSYILLLVFVGGMLVLFIYVTSLASNEMFQFSFKLMLILFTYMSIMIIVNMMLMKNMELSLIFNKEMINIMYMNSYSETFKSIYKLYNYPTNWITMLLINYLFFTLIAVVKITNFFHGPLRNMN